MRMVFIATTHGNEAGLYKFILLFIFIYLLYIHI